MERSTQKQGFTLIELSIVLVIIGLIVGGVLVGQDLIQSAKLRNLVSQKEQIVTAVNTFRLKYNGLPGDLKNATTFWGTDPNGCPTPGSTSYTTANNVTKTQTCNGDGDKKITQWANGSTNYYSDAGERFRFWQQLGNAGLIAGQFSGTNATAPDQFAAIGFIADMSVMGTTFPNMVLDITHVDSAAGSSVLFNTLKGHSMQSFHNTRAGTTFDTKTLDVIDMLQLEQKIDDTLPGQGSIMATRLATGNCTTSSNPSTATYNLSATGKQCQIVFTNLF